MNMVNIASTPVEQVNELMYQIGLGDYIFLLSIILTIILGIRWIISATHSAENKIKALAKEEIKPLEKEVISIKAELKQFNRTNEHIACELNTLNKTISELSGIVKVLLKEDK